MVRSLPPLNPLHVFEVAARLGSFTSTAEMLGVTPSAVSRQISGLEAWLGVRLFKRDRQRVLLTTEGAAYAARIAPAFAELAAATEGLRRKSEAKPISLRISSTFAVRFLIPRITRFSTAHPDIAIQLSTGYTAADFQHEAVDISIQIASGANDAVDGRALFQNWLQPMCSPELLRNGQPLELPEDLLHHRLLLSQNRRNEWPEWFAGIGMPDFPLAKAEKIEFPNSMLAYQAAADGQGVVIGQLPLLGPRFGVESLVPLFKRRVRAGSYYAVWRKGSELSRKHRDFLAWLEKEIAALSPDFGSEPVNR